MIITIKGADFSAKNIGTLSTWTIFTTLGSGATYSGSRAVDKDSGLSATITIADGYELGSSGVSVIMGTTDVTSSSADINGNTITINIATVVGNVTISVPTINTSTGEEEIPDYTFTIKPTPSNATVKLTASGYTQSGNSITVPNGTNVTWEVASSGYITQKGTWTANGKGETLSIALNKESIIPEDISAYIQEGKAIIKAGEYSDSSEMFTVVNYPVKGATYYLIPYARNAFCLTATGGASGGILAGGGKPDATLRAAGTAATMSICFKYADISPADVTITETTNPTTT